MRDIVRSAKGAKSDDIIIHLDGFNVHEEFKPKVLNYTIEVVNSDVMDANCDYEELSARNESYCLLKIATKLWEKVNSINARFMWTVEVGDKYAKANAGGMGAMMYYSIKDLHFVTRNLDLLG